jgi:hypothetical protein
MAEVKPVKIQRTGQRGSPLGIFLVVGVLCLAFAPGSPGQTSSKSSVQRLGLSEPTYPFCKQAVVSPFSAPLEELPALRQPPVTGQLPFAPSVNLWAIRGSLVEPGIPIGFSMVASRRDKVKLNLRVVGSISSISRNGEVKRLLMQAAKTVSSSRETRVRMIPSSKGIYRADVRFERLNGTRLQTYSQYFRVAPKRLLGRIGFSQETVAPGGSVVVRLENLGTALFNAGFGYWIERFNGSYWKADPTMQDRRRRIRVLRKLSPGESFDCWRLAVPDEQSAGLYRISKRIHNFGEPFIAQEFTVAP